MTNKWAIQALDAINGEMDYITNNDWSIGYSSDGRAALYLYVRVDKPDMFSRRMREAWEHADIVAEDYVNEFSYVWYF